MKKLENIKSIIIIRSGALGDTVYATSVLDALTQQFGKDITIDWIGAPSASSLFKYDSRVNKVFIIRHRRIPLFFSLEKRKIVKHSKKNPYDLLINLESDGPIFNPLAKAIQAKNKIGYPYTRPVKDPKAVHMVENIRTFYRSIVSDTIYKNSFPKLFGEPLETIRKKILLPSRYIVIAPSNSHTNRDKINYRAWPAKQWKELIEKLAKKEKIILVGNKGEEEYFKALQPYPENVMDLNGKTNLTELISVIEHANALITTDTGSAHIASATATPVYCLIGPTNPDFTGPYQTPYNDVHIISKNLDCSPCYYLPHIKECTDNICMKQISVDDVLNALKSNHKFN